MQQRIYLNNQWFFAPEPNAEIIEVRVPHTHKETPLNYFDENEYQFVSCYSRNLHADASWQGKRVLITFEGVAHVARVFIGDQFVGEHQGGYTAFTLDLSPYLHWGYENNLIVEVDSRESNNIPPFGKVIDYMTYGGIYRDVYLEIKELTYIQDVFVKTKEKTIIEEIEVEKVVIVPFEEVEKNQEEAATEETATEETATEEATEEIATKDVVTEEETTEEVAADIEVSDTEVSDTEATEEETTEEIAAEGVATEEPQGVPTIVIEKIQKERIEKRIIVELEVDGFQEDIETTYFLRMKGEQAWSMLNVEILSGEKHSMLHVIEEIEKWEIDSPILYEMKVELKLDNKIVDEKVVTFGFRTCEFKKDGFYLNDKKIKLMGLNRHQSYPYVGYAMPKRAQKLDADILKFELGVNAVRTSHYPQSQHFIERCDELGLLVFTEIPGWQHLGDEFWKDIASDSAEEMVRQYRNHPSIILWGARINESPDDDRLYRRTNKLIHGLDDTRQTGGVRCIKKSSLLEDVYTYNDFSHTGQNAGLEPKAKVTSNIEAPYLVSEYNGHMFPTKPFDNESHRLDHALRHANVLESLYEHEDIAGGFGWCMFDYNTHKDFGSGDRICYHGVMNMFRIPKLASSVYASQGLDEDVFEISSTMDIGEHPACNLGGIYAFTNADYVNVYKNDEFVKSFYPNKAKYGHLPHPPVLIDDFIGELLEKKEGYSHRKAEAMKSVLVAIAKYGQYKLPLKYKLKMASLMLFSKMTISDGTRLYSEYIGNWGGESTTYRFEAVKGEEVVRVIEKAAPTKAFLRVTTDTNVLEDDITYDVATVRVRVVDEKGEELPYYQGVITFETMGNIELIGPAAVTALGGSVGTYVKSIGRMGAGVLRISGPGLEEVAIAYDILKTE